MLQHLMRFHLQFVFAVDGRGGDEGMDAAALGVAHGFGAAADVFFIGARQASDGGAFTNAGDGFDGFEIANRGGGEARFDDVDADLVQEAAQLDFIVQGHGCAGRLFAVAHGGVENENAAVAVGDLAYR